MCGVGGDGGGGREAGVVCRWVWAGGGGAFDWDFGG